MSSQSVSILDGSTFVVSDRRGDIDASPSETHGLFRDDTRFLSTWILTLNDKRPNVLSVGELHYYEVQYFLAPSTGTVYVDSPVSVIRRRSVHDGFQEDLSVINHTAEVRELRIRMEADADFADLFEIKDVLAKKGKRYRRVEGATLILGYQRQRFVRETRIQSSQPPEHNGNSLLWKVSLPPHGEWGTHLTVDATDMIPVFGPKESSRDLQASHQAHVEEVRRWQSHTPRLSCSWRTMERTYERSVEDLAALRYYSLLLPGGALPAAGLPWFMAVFGRDSLITALQSLPYMPERNTCSAR
jgi:glycogen debranching enzyme